ncbi:hypothetical protein [Bosea lathyri]|uniref:Uncharacterized protein n=1 Tax=Bosea lathyri TaxID=1036778 RepID=A0A1H6D2D2_9HYPH|nr:hypothetical protein [Bosea lathyri]SEG79168.1 hypothetical protein SAMN04488115_11438 [Bosea lathyri]
MVQKPATIEALPQVAAPEQSPVLSGLNLPGVVAALLANNAGSLPDFRDVRRYIFSVYAGMAGVCGPHTDSASLNAMGYVEPGLGPGRDVAEVGMQKGMQFLMNLAQMHKSGDINAFAKSLTADAPRVAEGEADGVTIASRLGCRTTEYVTFVGVIERLMQAKTGTNPKQADQVVFATLMSPAFRNQHGIEDPAVTLRKRKIEKATAQARQLCSVKYDSSSFCGCLFGKLKSNDLSEDDWEAMGQQFSAVVKVASKKLEVAQSIRSCVRES